MINERRERTASWGNNTLDQAARTVEVMWSSGLAVKRYAYDEGFYMEELSMNPAHIRMERFEEGMSLLDSHESWSMKSRLGTVVPGSVRITGGKGYATIKLSQNEMGESIFRDLVDGHPAQISVGYKIHSFERIEGKGKELPTFRAIDWEPTELSIVPVPAEPGARTRSIEEETNMPRANISYSNPKPQVEEQPVNQPVANGDDVHAEHARAFNSALHLIVNSVLRGMEARNIEAPKPYGETRIVTDERDTLRSLAENAMAHRVGATSKLEDGARQYRGMSVIDIARDVLHRTGQNGLGAPAEIVSRSLHSTSDFPIILGGVVRQVLMGAYSGHQNTFHLIAHRNVVQDLRDIRVIDMGEAPQLELLTEKGEYKRGTVKESEESFSMAHYGKVIGFTEAMIINDQLDAFAKLIAGWGRVAARLEGDIVWDLITSNAKLRSDGKALFHADHGNLGTAATLTQDNLVDARKMFRKLKDIDGQQINIAPKYLFVGSDNEVPAGTITQATTSPQTTEQVVPEAIRSLIPVYEPRLDQVSEKAWFLFASGDETMGRGLQYAHLAGLETPRTIERWGFDYDGVEYRLDHYFGAGLTDFRFAYKNPGQ